MVKRTFQVIKRLVPRGIVPGNNALPPVSPGSGFYGGFVPTYEDLRYDFSDPTPPESRTDIVADTCNIGIQISIRSILFNYPPIQLVYRRKGCRLPPPAPSEESPLPIPPNISDSCGIGTRVAMQNRSYFLDYEEFTSREGIRDREKYEETAKILEWNYSNNALPLGAFQGIDYHFYARFQVTIQYEINLNYWNYRFNTPYIEPLQQAADRLRGRGWNIPSDYNNPNSMWTFNKSVVAECFFDSSFRSTVAIPDADFSFWNLSNPSLFIMDSEKYEEIKNQILSPVGGSYPGGMELEFQKFEYFCAPFKFLPPPLPPDKMSCCPNIRENDELLRLILKRIGNPTSVQIFDEDLDREGNQTVVKSPGTLFNYAKLKVERTEITNRLIGIQNYPVKVPESMIEPYKEGIFASIFGFFEGDKQREIKSVTELMTWMAEQDSAVLGQFHQVIEFEQDFDGDGKAVTEKVVLPNVAETLKEVILLLVQLANNEGTKVHALAKILIEISNIKANLFQVKNTIVDIQDYLDYPTNTKTVEVPLAVDLTIDEQTADFKNFFKESTGKVTFEDWDGTNSLHDNMLDLMQMATMLRAMLYQRTGQE